MISKIFPLTDETTAGHPRRLQHGILAIAQIIEAFSRSARTDDSDSALDADLGAERIREVLQALQDPAGHPRAWATAAPHAWKTCPPIRGRSGRGGSPTPRRQRTC